MLFEFEAFRLAWLLVEFGTDLLANEITYQSHHTRAHPSVNS